MILVNRGTAPPELDKYHAAEQDRLRKRFALPESSRPQIQPFDLNKMMGRVIRERIADVFANKCAFCESPAATVGHFRPRWRATRLDGRIDLDHYWWLATDWRNLYAICNTCDRHKRNHFPIAGPAARLFAEGAELELEEPLLLDPCHDNPEDHLIFSMDGKVDALTKRGRVTIDILRLDRPELEFARKDRARMALYACEALWPSNEREPDVDVFLRTVTTAIARETPYWAASRAAIHSFIRDRTATPATPPAPPPVIEVPDLKKLPSMVWLERIDIEHFKTITRMEKLVFPMPNADDTDTGQPWLMVLGENSVGKSSLLQAISLALMPDAQRAAFEPADAWLSKRKDVTQGHVRLHFSDGSLRELSFIKGKAQFASSGNVPPIPVLAYGSTRLLPTPSKGKLAPPALVSVDSLFDRTYPLVDAERYLSNRNRVTNDRFRMLATHLKDLLPVSGDANITRSGSRMRSQVDGKAMSLSDLSDGYQSVLALAMDIMYHLTKSSFDMESAQGLVMIDELELHLHPRWKMRIVGQLRTMFPNVRFVVSTHDPLCVQGARRGELWVLAKQPSDRRFMHEQIDVPKGTRADEVLTGPWFGLGSTMDSETLALMSEHSALLRHPDRGDKEQQRMEELEGLLRRRMGTFGDTRAQRAAMAVAAVLDHGIDQAHADGLIQHRLNQVLGGRAAQEGAGRDA